MRRRGVRVIAPDWQRTPVQMLGDGMLAFTLLCWLYLAIAYPSNLPTPFVPSWASEPLIGSLTTKIVGALLMTVGVVIYKLGVVEMGSAWRMGIDRDNPGPLATGGIFAWSRNPVYVGIELLFIGTSLIEGRLVFFALTAVFVLLIHSVIRREERFLSQQHDDAFREYCKRVGRYLTVSG